MQEIQQVMTSADSAADFFASVPDERLHLYVQMFRQHGAKIVSAAPQIGGSVGGGASAILVKQLEGLLAMPDATVLALLQSLRTLIKVLKPLIKAYVKVDGWTGGYAKWIALLLVAILAYYALSLAWAFACWMFGWGGGSAPATTAMADGGAAAPFPDAFGGARVNNAAPPAAAAAGGAVPLAAAAPELDDFDDEF